MSTEGSTSNTAFLVAELSFSFQDELTATIHNALGVAVEIAVVKITKLVSQVLRDVRDQMHETLRDNKSLKLRLQAAELELCAVRGRLEEEQQSVGDKASTISRIQQVHQQLNSLHVSQNTIKAGRQREHHDSNPLESEVKDIPAYPNESFCEIREDGRVCTHDIKPDLVSDTSNQEEIDTTVESKDQDAAHSRALVEPEVTLKNAELKSLVEVKVESADLGCNSISNPHTGEEDYCADSLSLAQSRLLEDWRPEPLQLHVPNDPDLFVPSTSHSLSDSPIFNPDIPDLDILTSSAPVPPAAFAKPYPPRGTTGASTSTQLSSEANNMGAQHVCKICGEKFHLSEELRRHRSLLHPKNLNKNPKRNLFPPGRSPYHCTLCGRDFNRMEHLKIHQRIHTGERPYACTVCNARFRHSWALTRHFRIHTGEKPYACSQCGKTFRNCGGLRFHQRSHSNGGIA